MVTITSNGVNLVQTPPEAALLRSIDATGVGYRIQAVIADSDATESTLLKHNLTGTLSWNDGGPLDIFTGTSPLTVDATRVLRPGSFIVNLYATDYALPVPSNTQVNYAITVAPLVQRAAPTPVIYGPILPRDQGFPGAQDWSMNVGSDIFILESSLKMLLSTAKGERIMEPDYGTNIKRVIFEANQASIEPLIQQEIAEAVVRWEPRVDMQTLSIDRDPNGRKATVFVTFVSKITGQGFQLALNFSA